MTRLFIFSIAVLLSIAAHSQPDEYTAPDIEFPTNITPPQATRTISVQEMLASGPPQLKMHSLSIIASGTYKHPIDESFLPGLRACANDPLPPIRSLTAKTLGKCFIAEKNNPNPEAITLLIKLAKDQSADVRYNAVYHGLCNIKNKNDKIITLLIEIGASDRKPGLLDRIAKSLENNQNQVTKILDKKLAESNNMAYFEIYQDFTGTPPSNIDKHLDMPSSRPRMFIFAKASNDPEKDLSDLSNELKAVGIPNPSVAISSIGSGNYALMVKTYIIKEGMAVEENFSTNKGRFKIIQQMWLTPELEAQMEALRSAQ
jgi:hypothetical protein